MWFVGFNLIRNEIFEEKLECKVGWASLENIDGSRLYHGMYYAYI